MVHSTMSIPTTIKAKASHPTFGAATLELRRTAEAKYSTAISKKMMKKMSMFMPWTVSQR